MIDIIEKEIKDKFKSWAYFCEEKGHDNTNFKRKLKGYIIRLNNWLEPLGLEVTVKKIKK